MYCKTKTHLCVWTVSDPKEVGIEVQNSRVSVSGDSAYGGWPLPDTLTASAIPSHCFLGGRKITVTACTYSVASRLQNCGNPTKYVYWPHKWKASTPIRLRKMRTDTFFNNLSSLFVFLLFLDRNDRPCQGERVRGRRQEWQALSG